MTFKVSDDFANPITQNIDLAIRIGNLTDSRLMSRLLGYSRRVVIAAPEYLARHGTPEHPNDLKKHACIVWTGGREGATWHFQLSSGIEIVDVSGPLTTDNVATANAAVAAGAGIGIAQHWQVQELLAQDRCTLLLTQYEPPPLPIHVIWPPVNHLPRRTRVATSIF